MKRKHLNLDGKIGNAYDDIEWMRINAEKDRIKMFKEVAKEGATLYYRILKAITEE